MRDNRPIDPDWFASVASPGWQKRWLENFTANTMGSFGAGSDEDLVEDGWTDITRRVKAKVMARMAEGGDFDPGVLLDAFEDADFEKMDEIRARVDEIVDDPEVGAGLKAWYGQLSKRPCFHDEYLPAFICPSVTLVDTDGKGVEQITERRVVVAGREYEVECTPATTTTRVRHRRSPSVTTSEGVDDRQISGADPVRLATAGGSSRTAALVARASIEPGAGHHG